ncbi:MAG: type transport system ATP-binding protein [Thermoleophilaceae bacterium]|nr:type transport system ATP-binding protein [Thermoleophilaceae bacterium]
MLALAAPALADAAPLGLQCTAQNGVRFCQAHAPTQSDSTDTRTRSFDGVPIDADVTLPPASMGDGPFPTIVMLHGYGNSKTDFETEDAEGGKRQSDGTVKPDTRFYHWNNVWFAQRGYVVVNPTARGFAGSCGAPASRTPDCYPQPGVPTGLEPPSLDPSAAGWLHLKDRRREAHDTQFLLGKLVDEGYTKPNALGATGISYGGGESMELAYLRNRIQRVSDNPGDFEPWVSPGKGIPMSLAAAFPRWPWSDLVSALLPNGRFLDFDASTVDKSRFPPGVPIQSYIEGLYALGNTSGWYAPPGADMTADVTGWQSRVAAGEPYSDPYAQGALNQLFTFHQAFGTPGSNPAPLLIQNGWTDDLFSPAEALRVYNSLRAADANADVALQFGDLGHSRGSNKANTDAVFNDQATAFFDTHLKGDSSTPPPARGSVTTGTQTCPKAAPGGGPFTADSWPAIHPGAVRFGSAAAQTVTSGGGNPSTAAAYEPAVATSDACKTVPDETAQGTAVYRFPKSAGFTMMGLPTVSATIATQGVNGQLDSRLWDVAPDGTQMLISRAAYRLEDNQSGRITFQLHGNGWVFAAGHVPKLELLGQDAPYLRPSNGAFQVTVTDAVIELPTLDKPSSSAAFSGDTAGSQIVQPVLGVGGQVNPAGAPKPQLRISYSPHKTRVGRRSRYLFRVRARSVSTGKYAYIAGARVTFAGKRFKTDSRGRVRTHHRFHAPGRRAVRASKSGYRKRTVHVRVLRHRRR